MLRRPRGVRGDGGLRGVRRADAARRGPLAHHPPEGRVHRGRCGRPRLRGLPGHRGEAVRGGTQGHRRDADRRAVLRRQPLRPERTGAAPGSGTAVQPQHPPHAGAGQGRRAADPRPVGRAVLGAEPRRRAVRAGLRGDHPPPAGPRHAAARHGRHALRRLGRGHARRRARHQRAPAARICPSTSPATRRAARSRCRTRSIASRRAPTRRCARRRASCCSPPPSNWCGPPRSRASSTSSRCCRSPPSRRSTGSRSAPSTTRTSSCRSRSTRRDRCSTRPATSSASCSRPSAQDACGQLPSVVAFQSAVDSTTGTHGVTTTVFGRLKGAQHRLVLFDVNRHSALRPGAAAVIGRAHQNADRGHAPTARAQHTLVLLTNRAPDTEDVEVREYTPGTRASGRSRRRASAGPSISCRWDTCRCRSRRTTRCTATRPAAAPTASRRSAPGRVRGEEGAIVLPLGALGRLRANPFWSIAEGADSMRSRSPTRQAGAGRPAGSRPTIA